MNVRISTCNKEKVVRIAAPTCVPTIVGRLSRSRAGLEKSYHGDVTNHSSDYMVHTEFGADMWTTVLEAGFNAVTIHAVEFAAALALSAQKT